MPIYSQSSKPYWHNSRILEGKLEPFTDVFAAGIVFLSLLVNQTISATANGSVWALHKLNELETANGNTGRANGMPDGAMREAVNIVRNCCTAETIESASNVQVQLERLHEEYLS
jgi:hypothetical protein